MKIAQGDGLLRDSPWQAARPTMRRVLVAGVAVALLAGFAWWSTHPRGFTAPGNRVGTEQAVLNRPLLVGMFANPAGAVELRGVKARVRLNTAAADIRVVLCRGPRDVNPVGFVVGSAKTHCLSLQPLHGSTLRRVTSSTSDQLLVEVIPRHPGRVLVDGVDVSYRSGIRFGTEATGVVIDVTAVPAR